MAQQRFSMPCHTYPELPAPAPAAVPSAAALLPAQAATPPSPPNSSSPLLTAAVTLSAVARVAEDNVRQGKGGWQVTK